jgi:trehalose transport system substrate-binding protein
MDLIPSVLSDLIAGLAASGIVASAALVARKLGWATARRLAGRLGWASVAAVFFGVSLLSAFLGGDWLERGIVLSVVLALTASVMVLRFGPERLHVSAPPITQPVVGFVRRYPWRILTVIFLLTTITLLVLNLRDGGDEPPGERIVFVVNLADEELIVFRDILDDLEPELGAQIFLMNVDSSRYVPRLDNMVAAGDMKWDLIAVDNNMLGALAAKDLVEELPLGPEYVNLVPDSLMYSLRPLLRFEGTFYFAPFRPNVKIAYYNEQKFAQYDLEPPRDWDQLLEVAKVFKEKEGVGRVAIQGHPGPAAAVTLFEFVTAAGGDPLTLDDDGSREALEFLQDLEPYLAPEYVETRFDTANELLIDDQVYLVSNWTFGIGVVVEDAGKEEIKAYSGWSGPKDEVHVLGGDVLAVPKGAPHRDRAINLMELLLSKETQQELLSGLRWLPVRIDAYDALPPELASYFDAVREAMSRAEARPTEPQWTLAENCLDHAFGGLIREGESMDLLEEYSTTLKEIPSEYVRYPVQPGDTLATIARQYRTTAAIIAEANRITAGTSIGPGQILLVPGESREEDHAPFR